MYGDPAGCIAPCMKVELPSEKSWNFITSCFEVLMTSDPAYTWLSWFQKLNIELWRLILFKVSFEFTPFCIAIFAYAFLQSVWAYLTTQPSVTELENYSSQLSSQSVRSYTKVFRHFKIWSGITTMYANSVLFHLQMINETKPPSPTLRFIT